MRGEDTDEDFADAVIQAAEDLPPGWKRQIFADGKCFYLNMVTNKGQLMKPTEAATVDLTTSDSIVAEMMTSAQKKCMGRHKGHLKKKTGIFGLWRKGYIVLELATLEVYATHAAYSSGVPPKDQMVLTGESDIAYGHMQLCFTVTSGKVTWKLMADDIWDLRHWTNAIATSIGKLYDARIKAACGRMYT